MIVEDIASQNSVIFETRYDWKDNFRGSYFPR